MVVSPKIGRLAIYGVDLTGMLFFWPFFTKAYVRHLSLIMRKPVLCHTGTTKAQIRLHIPQSDQRLWCSLPR